MSKPTASKRAKALHEKKKTTTSNDRGIYAGALIIGVFVVLLAFLLDRQLWPWATVAYVAFIAWLINLYAMAVYRGRSMSPWKLAFARVPLRFAGFGGAHGRPVEAAHDQPAARTSILVCAILSLAVVAGLALWLVLPQIEL